VSLAPLPSFATAENGTDAQLQGKGKRSIEKRTSARPA